MTTSMALFDCPHCIDEFRFDYQRIAKLTYGWRVRVRCTGCGNIVQVVMLAYSLIHGCDPNKYQAGEIVEILPPEMNPSPEWRMAVNKLRMEISKQKRADSVQGPERMQRTYWRGACYDPFAVRLHLKKRGGGTMKGRILVGLFLCSLFIVVGGDAQSPNIPEKPVWALEFIKVQPENFALALQYLDHHWMRVRAEAERQGAVLDYHLISNGGIVTPGHKLWDQDSIVLLTKYKNMDAYLESAFRARAEGWGISPDGTVRIRNKDSFPEDLFEPFYAQVFVEEPDTSTGFKLLTKQ